MRMRYGSSNVCSSDPEGLFHTWTIEEVREVLGADADAALDWYELTHPDNSGGNFEGRFIPARLFHRKDSLEERRVRKDVVSKCRFWCAQYTYKSKYVLTVYMIHDTKCIVNNNT